MCAATDTGQEITDSANLLDDFCDVVAQDLAQLAMLHDAEAGNILIRSLKQSGFPAGLGMKLESATAREALMLIEKALAGLPDPLDEQHADELAVDYAGIYLTHTYRSSPNESVWVDEENLERSYVYVERMIKFLLWARGAWKITFAGPDEIGVQALGEQARERHP
jgi:hypothetical protein